MEEQNPNSAPLFWARGADVNKGRGGGGAAEGGANFGDYNYLFLDMFLDFPLYTFPGPRDLSPARLPSSA